MLARVVLVVSFMGLVPMPATALAAGGDISATHTYILANFALMRASKARIASAETSVKHLIARFGQQCPNVAAGSPESEEAQRLTYEVAGALWATTYAVEAAPIRSFARAVSRLKWSNPKLARIAHRYVKSLEQFIALPVPNLCGDLRSWAADGFRAVPQSTISFNHRVEAIEGHTIPARLLAPYANAEDKRMLKRTKQLEVDLQNAETSLGFNDWNRLLATLGLNQ